MLIVITAWYFYWQIKIDVKILDRIVSAYKWTVAWNVVFDEKILNLKFYFTNFQFFLTKYLSFDNKNNLLNEMVF